jgi:hypothetical protein
MSNETKNSGVFEHTTKAETKRIPEFLLFAPELAPCSSDRPARPEGRTAGWYEARGPATVDAIVGSLTKAINWGYREGEVWLVAVVRRGPISWKQQGMQARKGVGKDRDEIEWWTAAVAREHRQSSGVLWCVWKGRRSQETKRV